MPTDLPTPRERGPTDLERYGHWEDVLIFITLVLLAAVGVTWLWG
jgi:hypothetical protein